jgi:hypothetical protein
MSRTDEAVTPGPHPGTRKYPKGARRRVSSARHNGDPASVIWPLFDELRTGSVKTGRGTGEIRAVIFACWLALGLAACDLSPNGGPGTTPATEPATGSPVAIPPSSDGAPWGPPPTETPAASPTPCQPGAVPSDSNPLLGPPAGQSTGQCVAILVSSPLPSPMPTPPGAGKPWGALGLGPQRSSKLPRNDNRR